MKQITLFRNNKRKMHTNKKGGIEGLPLQLLIIIVVASLGLAIMVGWMNNIEEPDMIDSVEATYEKIGDSYEITVRVLDQDGYAVEGADVIITGYGAYSYASTSTAKSAENQYLVSNVYINGQYIYSPTVVSESDLIAAGLGSNLGSYQLVNGAAGDSSERTTPHGITDSEGYATITVHFDSLKTYGTLNIEVTKTGYTGNNASMKVFA
ncbi:MAG: hypothetical protein IK043_00170 [Candidatus Methanomethylophilaceae archaeon]|nr:hypothetical protein [Candidatus Methanomethylophilaceae archaeon]